MQPNAKIQSIIELLELVYRGNAPGSPATPADVILNNYLRLRRYIGSSDRREITESYYQILKSYWQLQGYLTAAGYSTNTDTAKPTSGGQAHQLSRLHGAIHLMKHRGHPLNYVHKMFNGEQYSPAPLFTLEEMILTKIEKLKPDDLSEAARLTVSDAMLNRLKITFPETYAEEIAKQNESAPLDLRVNILKATMEQVHKCLRKEKIDHEKTLYSPWGLRLSKRLPLSQHKLMQDGWIEIQDEGSQLIGMLVDAKPGMHVWDYCAGAGGKTLAIAATMNNKGRIIASDALDWRLKKAPQRFRRAGIHNVECRLLDAESHKWVKRQYGKFDRVLVDAPCSGSGTWRRNPELKWRLSESDLQEICAKQKDILVKAAHLVKPGGRLIYATCSLYGEENQNQIADFLGTHPEFSIFPITLPIAEKTSLSDDSEKFETDLDKELQAIAPVVTLQEPQDYLQLSPANHGTDGFFACVMIRKLYSS